MAITKPEEWDEILLRLGRALKGVFTDPEPFEGELYEHPINGGDLVEAIGLVFDDNPDYREGGFSRLAHMVAEVYCPGCGEPISEPGALSQDATEAGTWTAVIRRDAHGVPMVDFEEFSTEGQTIESSPVKCGNCDRPLAVINGEVQVSE